MSLSLFFHAGHQRAANKFLHPGGPQPGIDHLPSAGCRIHQWLSSVGGNQRGHKGRTYQAGDWHHPHPAPSTGTEWVKERITWKREELITQGLHKEGIKWSISTVFFSVGVWLDPWWGVIPATDHWHHQGGQSSLLRDELPVPGHRSTATWTLGAQQDPGDAHHCFHSYWGLTHTHKGHFFKLYCCKEC